MSFLVVLALAGLAATAYRWPSRQGARESLLRAALVFGAIVTLATEGLSLAHAITARNVALLWVALVGLAGSAAFLARRGNGPASAGERAPIPAFLAAACGLILGATLLVAVVAPPDYPDVMTYHMGRVVHWIQAGHVGYYPSGIVRQNYQMPFAEFVILHLQVLSGGDRWANLVQWAAFALAGMTVSLILADLRQAAWVQWAGALALFATPMAILEASGAQNDILVGLWLLAFCLYLWRTLRAPSWESAVLGGLALGLALLTKGTAYLYAPAAGAALAAFALLRAPGGRRRPPLGKLTALVTIAACLNLGPWSRNLAAHGVPVCCGKGYFVERLTPGDAVSNVLRNTALHLTVPGLLGVAERAVDALSPVPLDDPATTFNRQSFDLSFSYHEGKAGNVLLLLLSLGAAVAIGADRRLRGGPAAAWMTAAVAAFLAYSLALKWQPWASRLHTPAFLLAAVPIALVLGTRRRAVGRVVVGLLVVGSLPYALLNQSRPLLPVFKESILVRDRIDQYFVDRTAWRKPYRETAAWVRASGEPEIGVVFEEMDYEYPFWVLLKDDPAGLPRVRHVGVDRGGLRTGRRTPHPPLVVTSRPGGWQCVDGVEYVRVRDFGELSVLRRAEPGEAAPEAVPGDGAPLSPDSLSR